MGHSAVIIGAGPGGGAAAVRLLQRGVKNVVVVDKDQFPRDKTCGSALSPNALKVVAELGLDHEVKRLGLGVQSLLLKTPGNRTMRISTGEGAAIILLRKHFDNLLLEKAKSLGVEFRGGWKATELVRDGGRVVGVRGKSDGHHAIDSEIRADYVIAADGAHSIFAWDPRPKRTISTLMGWWEKFDHEPSTIEMIFDKNLAPLYGWMFPETEGPNARVNIGICIDGEERSSEGSWVKTTRNVRDVFGRFLHDHFADRLATASQIGKLKGHPISYTNWVRDLTGDGILYLGEGGRMTHNATGEGIFHAMQSGIYAADAVADVVAGAAEKVAWRRYLWKNRQRFTFGFAMGQVLRGLVRTPLLDAVALGYNNPVLRSAVGWALGSTLAGSNLDVAPTRAAPPPYVVSAAPRSATN